MLMPKIDAPSPETKHILRKINLQFRKEKHPLELKQEYIRQALDYYHQTGDITKFEFMPPQKDKQKSKANTYTIQKESKQNEQNSNKKELTSFAVKFDKDGNAIAKDNQGNTLPPASPEEVFKTIVQKFKASGSTKLRIQAPNGKKDERISGIFAKECIMSGIAPFGDLPKSSAFWQSLKKEFLSSNHTPEEWHKLTAHIPEANGDEKNNNPKQAAPNQKESSPKKVSSAKNKTDKKQDSPQSDMSETNLSIKQSPQTDVSLQMMRKRKALNR